jgi:Dockerin type I domain
MRSSLLVFAMLAAQSIATLAAVGPVTPDVAMQPHGFVVDRGLVRARSVTQVRDGRLAALSADVLTTLVDAAVLGVPTATATATSTATDTPIDTPTSTASPTATDTDTPTPTAVDTDTPTPTPQDTNTPTATPTEADTATVTPTSTETATPTATPTSTFGVRGQIRYYREGRPVPGTDVDLLGTPLESAVSDAAGVYLLPEVAQEMRTLQPKKTGDFNDGITSLDGALVKQIVVGMETADQFQALACDVTGNGKVTSLDAARIIQFKLGIITKFAVATACGSDWLFLPDPDAAANQTLIQPQISSGSCQLGGVEFNPLVTPVDGQDFIAILFGDCTGNWKEPSPP